MFLIDFLFYPFLFIVKQLFFLAHGLTGNYGWAIVILSLGITLLLLPVFIFIEKAKKKDDAVKQKMKSRLDEIKRCYRGQERFYYIQTLNRQFNYSPLRSLIPILSLLIQIPFFIAAYQFLSNFESLKSVGFLFINDLSKPDALLGALHILPIAMTAVNLLSTYFYTRNGDSSERNQMLIVAGIFLVLLFNLPSGLVLYWTMNNVFSFFRLFITNPEVFKRREKGHFIVKAIKAIPSKFSVVFPQLKAIFIFLGALSLFLNINTALNQGFSDFFKNVGLGLIFSFLIVAFFGILAIIHTFQNYTSARNAKEYFYKAWSSFKTLLIIMTVVALGSQINWALLHTTDSLVQRLFFATIGSFLTVGVLSLIIIFCQGGFSKLLGQFQFKIRSLERIYRVVFFTLLSGFFIIQFIWSFYHGFNNILLKILFIYLIIKTLVLFLYNLTHFLKRKSITSFAQLIKLIHVKPFVYLISLFLSIYFYLASKFYFSGLNSTLSSIALFCTFLTQLFALLYLKNIRKYLKTARFKLLFVILLLLIIIQLAFFVAFLFGIELGLNFNHIELFLFTILGGLVFSFVLLPVYWSFQKKSFNKAEHNDHFIFSVALFYVLSVVFFWSPIFVYSSFPEAFSFPASSILIKNLPYLSLLLISSLVFYKLVSRSLKYILTIFIVSLALLFFVNIYIVPIDVGTLQLGKYIYAHKLAASLESYFLEAIFLIGIVVFVKWVFGGRYRVYIRTALLLLIGVAMVQSLAISISGGEFFKKDDSFAHLPNSISFSKTKKNVVYVIPDMFMGLHLKYILEENPDLKDDLKGFIYYPNTLSVSTNTAPSISSLYVGPSHNLDFLNQDKQRTMGEKITAASELFVAKIKSKGYSFTSTQMVYSTIDKNLYDSYLPPWHNDWNNWSNQLKIGGSKAIDYTILWKNAMFYGLPLVLKPQFYDHGNWIDVEEDTNKNTTLTQPANFIRLLPFISDTLNNKGSFIYIHYEATHGQWNIVDDNRKLKLDVSSYENQRWFIETFVKWIKWMKENGVYDNTKIVLVSDHSHYLPDSAYAEFGGVYKWGAKGEEKLSAKDFWRVNSLLMVKDYQAKGSLKEDWRFMSNSDVPSIVFDEKDPTKTEVPMHRILPVFFIEHSARTSEKIEMEIVQQFVVEDSVYDPANWKMIK